MVSLYKLFVWLQTIACHEFKMNIIITNNKGFMSEVTMSIALIF